MPVVHRHNNQIRQPFQLMKIHDNANGIQLLRGNSDLHDPIMPMQWLNGSII